MSEDKLILYKENNKNTVKQFGIDEEYFYKSIVPRFWDRVAIADKNECWEWTGEKFWRKDYGKLKLKNGRAIQAHRLSYFINYGNIDDKLIVRHLCGNAWCVNPNHLSIGTHFDNAQDKIGHGTVVCGEDMPSSKLTEKDVLDIRKLYFNHHLTLKQISKKYDVVFSTISCVVRGKWWKSVGGQINNDNRKKLTEKENIEIYEKFSSGVSANLLAKKYGVSSRTIWHNVKKIKEKINE